MRMLYWLMSGLLFFWAQVCPGGIVPVAVGSPQDSWLNLGHQVGVHEDSAGVLDGPTVLQLPANAWEVSEEPSLQLGYSTSVWWVRLDLRNDATVEQSRVLEVGWPLLNELDVWIFSGSELLSRVQTGDQRPFSQRPIEARDFAIPVSLPASSERTILMRMAMRTGIFDAVPLRLWTPSAFAHAEKRDDLILGLYFGAAFALMLYNLLLFLSIRDRSFLYYSLYLFAFALWMFGFSGYGMMALWRDHGWINDQMNLVLVAIAHVPATLFVTHYLDVRDRLPWLYRGLWWLTSLMLLPIVGSLLDQWGVAVPIGHVFYFYTLLSSLLTLLYIVTAGWVMALGYRPARFMFAGWACLVLSIVLYRLTEFPGFHITANPWTAHAMNIGSTLEFLLLALALGDRYKQAREEKLAAERAALAMEKGYGRTLEAQVNERTHALRDAMGQLNVSLLSERQVMAEQRAFLTTLSHELRSPLTVIDTVTQRLEMEEEGSSESERRTRYASILQASARLTSMLSDFLHEDRYSLVREGPQYQACDLRQLMEDARKSGLVGALGHRIGVDSDRLPERFICDPDLTRLALRNLVDNAVKYSPSGSAILLRGEHNSRGVYLIVRDMGPGIKAEELEQLFKPGSRGDEVKDLPGLGLGLSLSRQIIESQGGTLTAEAGIGEGTQFTVWLPHRDAAE